MKFVVGIDGSETASVAATRAGEMALKSGGSVHVVCAYSGRNASTIQVGSDSFTISNLTTAEQIAEQQAAAYRAQGIKSTSAAIDGKPGDVLIEEADADPRRRHRRRQPPHAGREASAGRRRQRRRPPRPLRRPHRQDGVTARF